MAIFILVIVHEWGHFIVARLCGVKVLRFSIGFGRPIFCIQSRRKTEYAVGWIPLGGYVHLLDTPTDNCLPDAREVALDQKPIMIRMLIVLAGPALNIVLAFLLFWLVLVGGSYSLAPIFGEIPDNTPAKNAGFQYKDEIVAINQVPVKSWESLYYTIIPYFLNGGTFQITVKRKGHSGFLTKDLVIPELDSTRQNRFKALGIVPFIPSLPPVIGHVIPNSPADKAGLVDGDKIKAVNGVLYLGWLEFVDFIRNHPKKQVMLRVERQSGLVDIPITIGVMIQKDKRLGCIGVYSKATWPKKWLRVTREDPLEAVKLAFIQTMQITYSTGILLGRLFTGHLALSYISGPVGIAQGARDSARNGWAAYLSFLALISISLGVLNLLPIPMLDGGHLLYYIIEAVIRRPLSPRIKNAGFYFGFILLASLMLFALVHDVSKLLN